MRKLALLLTLLLCLSAFSGCVPALIAANVAEQPIEVVVDGTVIETPVENVPQPVETAPVFTETEEPEPVPEPEPEPTPEHNEGDIDSDTQAQISAMEQNSSTRDDDVAPVEASAYCKLTVSCDALLEHRDELSDILLPPDGMFYSGTVVLSGAETALQLISDKLAACGLICELEDNDIKQVAAIQDDLIEAMNWVIFCNDSPLDSPEEYVIQSGDVLVLSYVPDNE